MVSKFYKISHKSLGNNSVKSYSGMYVRKACIYINVFDEKKLRRLKNILPQRREVVISGNGNCFY